MIPHNRISISDVKLGVDERHPEGRSQMIQENATGLWLSIPVLIAQQIAFPRVATGRHPRLNQTHDNVFWASDRLNVRRLGFNDQNVAVWQNIWARAYIFSPGATVGTSPGFQPTTFARCMGGKRYS